MLTWFATPFSDAAAANRSRDADQPLGQESAVRQAHHCQSLRVGQAPLDERVDRRHGVLRVDRAPASRQGAHPARAEGCRAADVRHQDAVAGGAQRDRVERATRSPRPGRAAMDVEDRSAAAVGRHRPAKRAMHGSARQDPSTSISEISTAGNRRCHPDPSREMARRVPFSMAWTSPDRPSTAALTAIRPPAASMPAHAIRAVASVERRGDPVEADAVGDVAASVADDHAEGLVIQPRRARRVLGQHQVTPRPVAGRAVKRCGELAAGGRPAAP